ncbi:MAG: SRPBCC family protein [Pseudonocardiaceae bacterium]
MAEFIEVSRMLPADPWSVAETFWDIEGWHRIWNPISEVRVTHSDPVLQDFEMVVVRDDKLEHIRTVRVRQHRDIEFFSPVPPPMMASHRGAWRFSPLADGCQVTAIRHYRLRIASTPEDMSVWAYRRQFRESFERRLGDILDCFVTYFSNNGEKLRPIDTTRGAAS